MADLQNLSLSTEGSLLTITINRESKLNALNTDTLAELKEVFNSIYDDKDIKPKMWPNQFVSDYWNNFRSVKC